MKLLDNIHSSADVKRLPKEQLPALCAEIRAELIEDVSRTGGHLASSLGAVELTVALHRVYDTSRDRLVFDVGHQCYAHKMLTGRRERFSTLRQLDGLAGFPRPDEAPDDPCYSGHASASISAALGMARARTLLGGDYDVCAVIGDGALTGGLAYEGLADCGGSGESIVVVLNDNEMSIGPNVGGLARFLGRQRTRPGYLAFKRAYHRTLGKHESIYRVFHRIKEKIKDLFIPDNLFEDMGFYYLGPIDGHDVRAVARTVRYAKELKKPVLVHVCTVKGKGYSPAEAHPERYHAVGPFDPVLGVAETEKRDFSAAFGSALTEAAEKDGRIVAVTAAMEDGTGLSEFARRFPERFFDVGIAEGHAVTMCAGMARQGLRPVFAVYSSFLQRGFDMLLHDVSLSGEHVVFAVDRAGVTGPDGETHQGCFDVGYLCQVPGMALWAPSDYAEVRSMLSLALEHPGPAALRYARGGEGQFREDTSGADAVCLREGTDLTIVSYGILINEALAAAEMLSRQGVSAAVIKLNRLDTPDFALAAQQVQKSRRLIVCEDCSAAGCVGRRLLAELETRGIGAKVKLCNAGSGVVRHGTPAELWHRLGIDARGIVGAYEELK